MYQRISVELAQQASQPYSQQPSYGYSEHGGYGSGQSGYQMATPQGGDPAKFEKGTIFPQGKNVRVAIIVAHWSDAQVSDVEFDAIKQYCERPPSDINRGQA